MGFLELVLAFIGFITVVVVVALYVAIRFQDELADVASAELDPHRKALAAAARISARGFEAEQVIHQLAEQARREER